MPVSGMLRISETGIIDFPEMKIQFVPDLETGYVTSLILEISDVPKENWPTLEEVEQDPAVTRLQFPFRLNPNVLRFDRYVPEILNLESMLGLVGLESIDIAKTSEEWIIEPGDESVSMQSDLSSSRADHEPKHDPLTDKSLAYFVVAASGDEREIGGLALLRVASLFFRQERYIDAIRYAYLTIEYLYANGQQDRKGTVREFVKSQELSEALEVVMKTQQVRNAMSNIKKPHALLDTPLNPESIFRWIFSLRGSVQHAKQKGPNRWHPSRQVEYVNECIFLINVADEACWRIAQRRLANVSTS